MSKKLEQVLECLINEESDRASELLHDVIVEKARTIYQELVNEADEDEDLDEDTVEEEDALEEKEECDEEAIDEEKEDDDDAIEENFMYAEADDEDEVDAFGGDETDDFADDIEADPEAEGEFGGEEGFEGEEEVEDRVEDLEAALADLRAEFDSLMGDEAGMEDEFAADDEFGGEEAFAGDEGLADEFAGDDMEENMFAEGIQDSVADPSNTEDAGDKKSMYTVAPKKKLDGADPIKGDTSEEAGGTADSAKEETPTDNVSVDHKPAPKGAESKEGQTDSDALFTKEVK